MADRGRVRGGALLLCAAALYGGGWALWLLWGAVSLLLVALAYAAIGAGAFQKGADGRLSVAARWLFAPYLAGAWLNSRAWTWRDKAPVAVADGVFLGRVPTQRELAASAVRGVVDLTAEFDLRAPGRRGRRRADARSRVTDAAALAQAARAHRAPARATARCSCAARSAIRAVRARSPAWLLASGRARDVGAALARGARRARVRRARRRPRARRWAAVRAAEAGGDQAEVRMRGAD